MSIPFSFEQLARIRDDIVVRTAVKGLEALFGACEMQPLVQSLFVAVLPKPSTPDVTLAAVQNVARVEGVTGS
jgi:hypothetical protein